MSHPKKARLSLLLVVVLALERSGYVWRILAHPVLVDRWIKALECCLPTLTYSAWFIATGAALMAGF